MVKPSEHQSYDIEHAPGMPDVPPRRFNRWYHVLPLGILVNVLLTMLIATSGLLDFTQPYTSQWIRFCDQHIANRLLAWVAKMPTEPGFWQNISLQVTYRLVDRGVARLRNARSWSSSFRNDGTEAQQDANGKSTNSCSGDDAVQRFSAEKAGV